MLTGVYNGIAPSSHPSEALPSEDRFIVGSSPAMIALKRVITDIASTEMPVLLIGESGTGKEMAALEIHRLSSRSNEPFLKCNCAAQETESLNKHLRSCENSGTGRNGGTIYLDEVGHLNPSSQLALLHCFSGNEAAPPGRRPFARVISATTQNLDHKMRDGHFRKELYYRIEGICLRLPPLRSRTEDIGILFDHFLKRYAALFQRSEPQLKPGTMDLLIAHSWPGNVRELENLARKIIVLGDENLALADLLTSGRPAALEAPPLMATCGNQVKFPSLKEVAREASRKAERELIVEALERTHWNRKKTSRDLQVSYKALLYKMKQLGLDLKTEPALSQK